MPILTGALSFGPGRMPFPGDWDHREPGLVMSRRGAPVWTSSATRGPVTGTASGLVLAWDGRIDNREDLLLQLGERDLLDDDIAILALERWGTAALAWLVGDWSLAVWDRHRRTLHLARDYMGARPLYYSVDEHGAAWSTDLAELVERCKRGDALSDTFAAYFMNLQPVPALTPYENVRAVPPGVCVSFTAAGAITERRFWTLRTDDIRFHDPRRYEEELRALWEDAVRVRLRTKDPVWAELSGGLDSSSIVCMAGRLIAHRAVPVQSLRLVSHATLHSPEGDERRFIEEVEHQVGVTSDIVGVEENQTVIDEERAWVTPYALQDVGLAMVRRVRAGGGRVILSGRLGDAIMGCQPDNSEAAFDDLARLNLLAAVRNLRAWSRATRKPFVELAWRLFAADLPAPGSGARLLVPRLRSMLLDAPRVESAMDCKRSKRTLARMVLGYAAGARLDIPLQPPDVVYTYPFAHRPLVEFVLAIPGVELSAPGVTRSLMRRAFKGLLPPRILARQSKGYYPPSAFRAARQHVASIVDVRQLQVVERGWIDGERLRQALRTFVDGGGQEGADIHLVLRLERWLQARAERGAIPQRKEVNSDALLNA